MNAYLIDLSKDQYDEHLNNLHGTVEICGYTYNSAEALMDVDHLAYETGFVLYVISNIGQKLKLKIAVYSILDVRILSL